MKYPANSTLPNMITVSHTMALFKLVSAAETKRPMETDSSTPKITKAQYAKKLPTLGFISAIQYTMMTNKEGLSQFKGISATCFAR
mmetsp:Transcript_14531/g.27424  ORF Transcript_14531/g.27424 Transcript_14531/m.27424 type:complete len:86 (-) Transcript_14531:369-626(-)